MLKYGNKLKVRTLIGTVREGYVKEVLPDGSVFVEIDEQILPNLDADVVTHDRRGRPFVIYKSKFPTWQAWVPPKNVLRNLTQERLDVV